ncbi:MAG: transcription elongation factor GreA [Salinivirgaceae bacterium]|nr:MAG: transcription elongation factor GreA [Salinivirgaceae bacterium]
MSKLNYVTAEGLKKLKDELDQLKTVERRKASQAIAEARDKGDLSENAEYDAAKEAQGLLELRISKMEQLIQNSRVIDESKIDFSKVQIMTKVKIRNSKNKAVMEYSIVSESEADLKQQKIAVSTPIAKGLLGKKVGDKALIQVPAGNVEFEILEISPMN